MQTVATLSPYYWPVSQDAAETLARNLKWLMERAGDDQVSLAKRCGLGQRTISGVLRAQHAATLTTVAELAKAYDLPAWCLLVEGLREDHDLPKRIDKLVSSYLAVAEPARVYFDYLAEQERQRN